MGAADVSAGGRPVALVTGAARGIGAATVAALAADGWFVVAVDRGSDDPRLPYRLGSERELRGVAEAAGRDRAVAVLADTTDRRALASAFATAREHGRIKTVIAAAGVIAGGVPLWEMAEEQLEATVEVNLGGVIAAARAGIPELLSVPVPRRGRFIAIASTAASRGLPMLAAYCATKAAVVGLVRALSLELRGSGVTANCVSPGSTSTDILDESARLYGLRSAEDFSAQQPLGRLIAPEEVAELIRWLASPAADALLGSDVTIDGGLSL